MKHAGKVYREDGKLVIDVGGKLILENGAELAAAEIVQAEVVSLTTAQINAGAAVMAARAGTYVQVIGAKMRSTGVAAGATAVAVMDEDDVVLASIPVASLTDGKWADETAASAVLSLALPENKAIKVGKTGADLTGSTAVAFIISYIRGAL